MQSISHVLFRILILFIPTFVSYIFLLASDVCIECTELNNMEICLEIANRNFLL